jgi:hypothetical protein
MLLFGPAVTFPLLLKIHTDAPIYTTGALQMVMFDAVSFAPVDLYSTVAVGDTTQVMSV